MRVALVTGASRGLGREIARALARAGYVVAANYLTAEAEAQETVSMIGTGSFAVRADVGDPAQVLDMRRLIEKRCGRLDVIVSNAGIARDDLLVRQSEKDWDDVIETNLTGSFNVIRLLSPLMVQSGGGHIVTISSRAGHAGKAGQAAYSAAKAGLLGVTRTAAVELAADNIRVNAVLPGYLMTEMGKSAERAADAAKKASLLNRLSDPKEVAGFIAFLVGTEGVTGQVFSIDSRP
ncbi:MAG: SDR family oxidoreductase [Nitrospiraceae bacterium]|nr:SDR family oxidoreductase [Nitrospiraceae bacterium]